MEKSIQIHGAYALIKPVEPEKQVGSILLPETAQRGTLTGVVVEVGKLESPEVVVGSKVLYKTAEALTMLVGSKEKYLLIPESELLGIWSDD
jgi:co-chaperonin GroES (HSP10)